MCVVYLMTLSVAETVALDEKIMKVDCVELASAAKLMQQFI
jgi:hypothetical protein